MGVPWGCAITDWRNREMEVEFKKTVSFGGVPFESLLSGDVFTMTKGGTEVFMKIHSTFYEVKMISNAVWLTLPPGGCAGCLCTFAPQDKVFPKRVTLVVED